MKVYLIAHDVQGEIVNQDKVVGVDLVRILEVYKNNNILSDESIDVFFSCRY